MSVTSPIVSPSMPLCRAVYVDSGLKAHCAVAKSDSPGIVCRPVVHSRHVGVEGHPVGVVDEHMCAEEVCERPPLLVSYVAAQVSAETQYGINKALR